MDDSSGGDPTDRGNRLHPYGSHHQRPIIAFVAQVAAVIVGVLILLVAIQAIYGQDTTHEDLNARLVMLEEESRFQSCLLQLPADERTPAVIAECANPPALPE